MSNSQQKKGYEYRHIYYVNKMVSVSNLTFTTTPKSNIHFHNGYEILLVTQGKYTIYAPNKLYEGEGPCVAMFRFGTYHGCIFSDCESLSASRFVINYTQSFIDSIPMYMLDADQLFENDVSIIPLDNDSFQRMQFLFSEFHRNFSIYKKIETISPKSYGYMTVILNTIGEVLKNSNAILANVCGTDDNYIYDVIRMLLNETESDKPISVSSLSNQFFVSRTKLADDFQRVTGISIKTMIDDLRIERVKKLISLGLSNKEITEQCGFSSDSYFAQFFYRHTNMSPQAYRKLNNIK